MSDFKKMDEFVVKNKPESTLALRPLKLSGEKSFWLKGLVASVSLGLVLIIVQRNRIDQHDQNLLALNELMSLDVTHDESFEDFGDEVASIID